MKFWEASAIIPLCIEEQNTPLVQDIAKKDGAIAVWWGSIVECYSAVQEVFLNCGKRTCLFWFFKLFKT